MNIIINNNKDNINNMINSNIMNIIINNKDNINNIIHSNIMIIIISNNKDTDNINNIINTETPLFKIKEHIYQEMNQVWTTERKNILFGFIKEIVDVNNLALKQNLLDGLTKFMDCMDIFVSNILLNNRL